VVLPANAKNNRFSVAGRRNVIGILRPIAPRR
jgi:hypothetical protein